MLQESDTDVSSILTFNGYTQTLDHTLYAAKKNAYGINMCLAIDDFAYQFKGYLNCYDFAKTKST